MGGTGCLVHGSADRASALDRTLNSLRKCSSRAARTHAICNGSPSVNANTACARHLSNARTAPASVIGVTRREAAPIGFEPRGVLRPPTSSALRSGVAPARACARRRALRRKQNRIAMRCRRNTPRVVASAVFVTAAADDIAGDPLHGPQSGLKPALRDAGQIGEPDPVSFWIGEGDPVSLKAACRSGSRSHVEYLHPAVPRHPIIEGIALMPEASRAHN